MNRSPNVLWIVTDQQRYETLSINGCKNASTPELDSLARTGLNFTGGISGFPLCCPYRGSMLTSRYPHKCVPGHQYRLPPELPTVADAFRAHGYHTFYLGKWHLDGAKEDRERAGTHFIPRERRGHFDSWLGYENNNAQYDCWIHGHRDGEEVPMFRLPGYETDCLTDMMIEYLKQRSTEDAPFFAVLSIQPPHDPYVAPGRNQKGHTPAGIEFLPNVPDVARIRKQAARELAGYYAMVENIDENVGRIVNCLNETGLMDSTHILYFSDHGDMHGSHGQFRKMTPYQEAINTPLIISGEKRHFYEDRYAGREVNEVLVNHVDLAPTSLGLCGLPVPEWMEGTDYSALRIRGKPRPEYPSSAYLQSVIPTYHGSSTNKPWRGIITTNGYKYACFEGMDWMMFNLNEDPYEQVNLVHDEDYKALRKSLLQQLRQWAEKTGDTFVFPADNPEPIAPPPGTIP